jgi:hypothetical protein
MGTWISHLRVAELLFSQLPGLDETAFILGSLAPDSGIPNADWTVFDPPKTVTHFLYKGEDEGQIRDLLFYRQYLSPLGPDSDPYRYSFALAYFFHLLCDSLWVKRIWVTTRQVEQQLIAEIGKLQAVNRIKEDWYGLDQRYVRDHRPDCVFWRVLMPAANPQASLPFISDAALGQQLDYIRSFYSQPDSGWVLDRPYPYLNEATVTRFVADCAAATLKIYQRLQVAPPPADALTALSLLDEADLAPYAPPLGDTA